MAKLKGLLPLQGTIQNITFAETKNGVIARGKTSLDKKRISEDANYGYMRAQSSELTEATYAGRLVRQALKKTAFVQPDSRCVNRLTSRMSRVLKSDATHSRGKRKVTAGDLQLLRGFEFNSESMLCQRLFLRPTISFDRVTGLLSAQWNSFFPDCVIDAPEGATHVRLVAAGVLADFAGNTFRTAHSSSQLIAFAHEPLPELLLTMQLPAESAAALVLAIGLEFYELVHGIHGHLDRGKQNAMAIVEVAVA